MSPLAEDSGSTKTQDAKLFEITELWKRCDKLIILKQSYLQNSCHYIHASIHPSIFNSDYANCQTALFGLSCNTNMSCQ